MNDKIKKAALRPARGQHAKAKLLSETIRLKRAELKGLTQKLRPMTGTSERWDSCAVVGEVWR